ncbi:ATP phosphoribosyltransferase [Methylovulum psychrotolerans]|jgi:ATP phosphoribosyltransferase|uniref:ATP phosphoribosyltransferase n=1 Tax=Methylovulum psychrotolerans TaxID=1704499 RepID=A0A1Z4BYK6_9GAMM|nr:ATP phosphoribosyltransferase [Methylovulum psychrotolerans]ASF46340.1 ATP phosphoribosyltransferase [Methylovulum psychrotolerans]MBT9099024.1 ATP phosphoribosyltransferase [Methylovulum psychrotolerans]POZ50950.1 ATP phosphoribosyltransferase [Methylovulum psychrotolerans]
MLTIAVSKGRIYEEALPFLAEAGIVPTDDPTTCRKLILQTTRPDVQLVIIRATDVPTFVEYGAADLGIAGKDVLLEHGTEALYEPLDLNIARCRLMTAAHKDAPPITGRVRVATKYVKTAQSYFASLGIQAEIIKLYGSMELAPLVGLADCIVDLVDTGNTLKANDLEPRELIMNISSRLVVNKAAMKMKNADIAQLLAQFEKTLAQRV